MPVSSPWDDQTRTCGPPPGPAPVTTTSSSTIAAPAGPSAMKTRPAPSVRPARMVRMARFDMSATLTRHGCRAARALDPDALCEQLAVVRGVAEQQLGRLGPLEVQVGV